VISIYTQANSHIGLSIGINEKHPMPAQGQGGAQVDTGGGFAYPALKTHYRYLTHTEFPLYLSEAFEWLTK
jgi:hypothetical protein